MQFLVWGIPYWQIKPGTAFYHSPGMRKGFKTVFAMVFPKPTVAHAPKGQVVVYKM